jgi:hypothetical protein
VNAMHNEAPPPEEEPRWHVRAWRWLGKSTQGPDRSFLACLALPWVRRRAQRRLEQQIADLVRKAQEERRYGPGSEIY